MPPAGLCVCCASGLQHRDKRGNRMSSGFVDRQLPKKDSGSRPSLYLCGASVREAQLGRCPFRCSIRWSGRVCDHCSRRGPGSDTERFGGAVCGHAERSHSTQPGGNGLRKRFPRPCHCQSGDESWCCCMVRYRKSRCLRLTSSGLLSSARTPTLHRDRCWPTWTAIC